MIIFDTNYKIIIHLKIYYMKRFALLTLLFATILISCNSKKTIKRFSDAIRINQIGYYPNSEKQFVLADVDAVKFDVVNENDEIEYSGKFTDNGKWEASGEKVLMGDFTKFNKEGKYTIIVDDTLQSYLFEIKKGIYKEALNATIKSYYFQRASIPIEEQYGGVYKRALGHPDEVCNFHPSTGHSTGSLNSPGGWYDAGDYGKYIVNAALSTGQMLLLVEQYPTIIADGTLNIPESGNGISDIMDELKYELDWILTMQDLDGGVFHKVTAKIFSGFIMPEDYDLERLIIGKGTAATLDFSAVLAQASRLYSKTDKNWSEKALKASEKAWNWAVKNNNVAYAKNPDDVITGPYDDTEFSDDFYWAAAELFISTKNSKYSNFLNENEQPYTLELTNSWKNFVRNNAFHSLLLNIDSLDQNLALKLKQGQLKIADEVLDKIAQNPYRIGLDIFEWGSNSDVLNQAVVLCFAHKLTGEEKYLGGAEQITDYIFGKNATGYCFLTGFGSKKVMFPHHRPSGADKIDNPIPGFIIGGPNNHKQDAGEVNYTSNYPAKSYMNLEASYASNEVCLNWNAPAVYILGYLEKNH